MNKCHLTIATRSGQRCVSTLTYYQSKLSDFIYAVNRTNIMTQGGIRQTA